MNKTVLAILIGVTLSSVSVSSFAFGLGDLGGGGSSAAAGVTAEQLVEKYIGGSQNVLNAQAKMLFAVGEKDDAAKAKLAAKNLTTGATEAGLKEAQTIQTNGSKAIADKMSGVKIVMDADSKKQFTLGLVDLAKGIKNYIDMSSDVSGFKPSMTSMGSAATSALFIVKSLPDTTKNLLATLKSAVAFAKENKIEVPKEATSALPG